MCTTQNTRECRREFQEYRDDFVKTREVKKKRDVAILNALCLHAGGDIVSTERRVMFYFTLRYDGELEAAYRYCLYNTIVSLTLQ